MKQEMMNREQLTMLLPTHSDICEFMLGRESTYRELDQHLLGY